MCKCISVNLQKKLIKKQTDLTHLRLAHSADVYNLHGAKRLVTIPNVLSASGPAVKQDGENKPFLARLHEVHRAIVVTSVVRVYVCVRVTLSVKVFYMSISLDHVDGSS